MTAQEALRYRFYVEDVKKCYNRCHKITTWFKDGAGAAIGEDELKKLALLSFSSGTETVAQPLWHRLNTGTMPASLLVVMVCVKTQFSRAL